MAVLDITQLLTEERPWAVYAACRDADPDLFFPDQDDIEAAGLPGPQEAPHAFYSPGVDVEVAWFSPIWAAEGATERRS